MHGAARAAELSVDCGAHVQRLKTQPPAGLTSPACVFASSHIAGLSECGPVVGSVTARRTAAHTGQVLDGSRPRLALLPGCYHATDQPLAWKHDEEGEGGHRECTMLVQAPQNKPSTPGRAATKKPHGAKQSAARVVRRTERRKSPPRRRWLGAPVSSQSSRPSRVVPMVPSSQIALYSFSQPCSSAVISS